MKAANVRLFLMLAKLYPDAAESSLLMAIVGIDAGRIHSEQGARTRWFEIVNEAEKAGQIPGLMSAALADYPKHDGLHELRKMMVLMGDGNERPRVLMIFPDAVGQVKLNTDGDADALYQSGLDAFALSGSGATRDAVVREWRRIRPSVVVVGGHGKDGQIYLSDGPSSVGWWQRIIRLHAPELVLLMACESSTSAHLDIPDALLRAGVKDVIAINASVLDTDAVLFERIFFENLLEPMSVSAAYDIARLSLPDDGAAMMRHRQDA